MGFLRKRSLLQIEEIRGTSKANLQIEEIRPKGDIQGKFAPSREKLSPPLKELELLAPKWSGEQVVYKVLRVLAENW